MDKCATAEALALLDSEGARLAPGVSLYSIPAGALCRQMLVVANHAAILNEETAAPVQATEEIAITKAENTFNTKMANMMKPSEPWTIQLSNVNEPRYGGYQTARAYAIEGDNSPPQTPMNFSPRNTPTGPAFYRPGPNYQHHPWQGFSPCIYCDEQGHIHTFYPDVHTDLGNSTVHSNDHG